MRTCLPITLSLILLARLGAQASSQEPQTSPGQPASKQELDDRVPQLRAVFSDDFSKDTRAEYSIKGDVSWKSGRVILAPGSSLSRAVRADAWAKVTFDVEWPRQSDDSILRVWFRLIGATSCFVQLRQHVHDGQSVQSIIVGDTSRGVGGQLVASVVREGRLLGSGPFSAEYRHGVISVSSKGKVVFWAYIENGGAWVDSVQFVAAKTRIALRNVKAVGQPRSVKLSLKRFSLK